MLLRPGSRSFPDAHFRSDANAMPDSNLVASMGPQFADMANFILDTAFNETKPIQQIVALCDPATIHTSHTADSIFGGDCYDYFLTSREVEIGIFSLNIKRVNGHTTNEDSQEPLPAGLIQSRLDIKAAFPNEPQKNTSKSLQVTFFETVDGAAISLTQDYQKQIVWDLSIYAQTHPILVHCQSGIGRTGSFILTLELLKHFDAVFASKNVKTIAENIHAILQRLRSVRPALVISVTQFASAIQNAAILRDFALKKGYISRAEMPSNDTSNPSIIGNKPPTQTKPATSSNSDEALANELKKPKLR
jgi:predicted protein tyrosine phosphatase